MAIKFSVNGASVTVDVPDDMPLLWVLRDVLGMKGTKFGCGISQCGACSVHVNGRLARSCRTRISTVDGDEITTIEGLSPTGDHPLQNAWRELDVPQCGYCQAGQLMAASALLNDNPQPTDEDIDRSMVRNICRCGTYTRVREGIHHAARAMADDSHQSGQSGHGGRSDSGASSSSRDGDGS